MMCHCVNKRVHDKFHQMKVVLTFNLQGGWSAWVHRKDNAGTGKLHQQGVFRCPCGMTDGDAAKVKAHAAVCLSACKPNISLVRYRCQQLKAAASYPSPPSSPSISPSTISSSISPSHSPPGPL